MDDLAFTAYANVGMASGNALDALEAAARLREGKLPGTPEWGSSEEDYSEDDSDTE